MNPLDSYLARVARELRSMPQSKRDDELRELHSHLEQRVEDFEAQGLSPETARTRAIHDFGSPRALGSKLCDAWEGIHFSPWRLISTLIGVTILWFITLLLLWLSVLGLSVWDNSALLPELPYILVLAFAAMPFLHGWLLSRLLGRRGPLTTLLYFGFLLCLSRNTPVHIAEVTIRQVHFDLFNLIMAFCGSVCATSLHRRSLRLALTGGQTLQTPSPTHRWRSFALASLLTALAGTVIYLRVYTAFHPATPIGVLRAALLSERGMNHDLSPPTILQMDELPPTTAAERSGQQKRIFFRVEVSATQEYAARRVAFLNGQLADAFSRDSWGEKYLRRSLERLKVNRHQVQGTARLIQTSQGWQIDRNSFDHSQFGAWCYDIYYGGIDQSP